MILIVNPVRNQRVLSGVKFKNLALVIIDEQHRFGVEQRRTLRLKGGDRIPHALLLTATPIPRTLALTAYGDLTVTTIKELPWADAVRGGRIPLPFVACRKAAGRCQYRLR